MKKKIIIICVAVLLVIGLIVGYIINNKTTTITITSKNTYTLTVKNSGKIVGATFSSSKLPNKLLDDNIENAPKSIYEMEKENNEIDEEKDFVIEVMIDSDSEKIIKNLKDKLNKNLKIDNKEIGIIYQSCTCENTVCKKSC